MPETLIVVEDGRILADDVRRARGFAERVRGFLGADDVPEGTCLVLTGAKQVHTFGMRFDIDVVFTDAHGKILHLVERMVPNRMTRVVLRSRIVLELKAGAAAGLTTGDRVAIRDV